MKRLDFDGEFNLPLLCEELFAAFPEWVEVRPEGRTTSVSVSSRRRGGIYLIVPDDTDEIRLGSVIRSHNPSGKSKNQQKKEKKDKAVKDVRKKLQDLGFNQGEIDVIVNP